MTGSSQSNMEQKGAKMHFFQSNKILLKILKESTCLEEQDWLGVWSKILGQNWLGVRPKILSLSVATSNNERDKFCLMMCYNKL